MSEAEERRRFAIEAMARALCKLKGIPSDAAVTLDKVYNVPGHDRAWVIPPESCQFPAWQLYETEAEVTLRAAEAILGPAPALPA